MGPNPAKSRRFLRIEGGLEGKSLIIKKMIISNPSSFGNLSVLSIGPLDFVTKCPAKIDIRNSLGVLLWSLSQIYEFQGVLVTNKICGMKQEGQCRFCCFIPGMIL